MTNVELYQLATTLGISPDELEFSLMVDEMPIEDRIELRAQLERAGDIALPRNLYFDYGAQKYF